MSADKLNEIAEWLAAECSRVAVAPLEGRSLDFDAALEMAVVNVAARIKGSIRAALDEAGREPPTDPKVLIEWYRNDAAFHRLVDTLVVERLDSARQEDRAEIELLTKEAEAHESEMKIAEAEIERLRARVAASHEPESAKVYALLVGFFGGNLRGAQHDLYVTLSDMLKAAHEQRRIGHAAGLDCADVEEQVDALRAEIERLREVEAAHVTCGDWPRERTLQAEKKLAEAQEEIHLTRAAGASVADSILAAERAKVANLQSTLALTLRGTACHDDR